MPACPKCGEENPDRARYCMGCSAPLDRVQAADTRRTVTVVFSDLVGSTALGERLDPEALREVLGRYFDVMRGPLEEHGGTVEKYIGDAIMAVFGLPHAREDDALRAATTALRMREALVGLNDELERTWGVRLSNRTGVHTGEVVAGDPALGQRLVTGDAVNTAARLEQAAPADEVLIGEPTYRLVRHAVTVAEVPPVTAKGKADPVPAYRLLTVETSEAVARRSAPMVGRRRQLDALEHALDVCVERRACGLAIVVGDPGVGKSRLVNSLVDGSRERAQVLQGRCLSEGREGSLWAIAEAVRSGAGIDVGHDPAAVRVRLAELCAGAEDADLIVERTASMLGASSAVFPAEEIIWGVRRLIERVARVRPVLLVVDDLHWAGPATLDVVAGVADRSRASILVVCITRPELLDERAEWIAERRDAMVVDLEPFSLQESAELIGEMVGADALSEVAVRRVHEAAEGNPLFVEQTIATWLEAGVLVRSEGVWTVDANIGAPPVPPSIQALLAARLDALKDVERAVVERGAVVGEVFPSRAVSEMMPAAGRPIGPALSSLTTKRLLRPGAVPTITGDWAFAHRLVRDAAYDGMLKRTRAALHERFAAWLDASPTGALAEQQAIVATHLETAYRLSSELGRADSSTTELGHRAAELLEAAALRALESMLHEVSSSCYERAARCRQPGDSERSRLLSKAAEMAMWAGDVPRVSELAGQVAADAATDPAVDVRLRLARLWVRESTSGSENVSYLDEALAVVEEARRRDDQEGLAVALRFVARHLGWLGRVAEARAASLEDITAARAAGRPDIERNAQTHYAMAAIFDRSPVSETIEWCRGVVASNPDDRVLLMEIARPMAILSAMRGDVEDAEALLARYSRINEELGPTPATTFALAEATAFIADLEGDHARVERVVRPVFDALRAAGDTNVRASMAGLLAEAAIATGDVARADEMAEDAEMVASADDYDAQARWRMVRAQAFARSGAPDAAVALADEAVSIAASTEDANLHGHTLFILAEVLEVAGGSDRDPRPILNEAIELFDAKGCVIRADRARAAVAGLR